MKGRLLRQKLVGSSSLSVEPSASMLIFTGTRRIEWPLLYVHIIACVAGGALIVADWMGHHRGFAIGAHHATATMLRCAFFLPVAAALSAGACWLRTVPWERNHASKIPVIAPASMDTEGDGPSGPFFPSSAQTLRHGQIPASYFMESKAASAATPTSTISGKAPRTIFHRSIIPGIARASSTCRK